MAGTGFDHILKEQVEHFLLFVVAVLLMSHSEFGLQASGFRNWGPGSRVWGSEFRVQGSGSGVCGIGFTRGVAEGSPAAVPQAGAPLGISPLRTHHPSELSDTKVYAP